MCKWLHTKRLEKLGSASDAVLFRCAYKAPSQTTGELTGNDLQLSGHWKYTSPAGDTVIILCIYYQSVYCREKSRVWGQDMYMLILLYQCEAQSWSCIICYITKQTQISMRAGS